MFAPPCSIFFGVSKKSLELSHERSRQEKTAQPAMTGFIRILYQEI
jgi:hypothetical protein